jgi:hypothetical protein
MVHTGQHHDDNMSRVFFEQLEIPEPHRNLGISGGSAWRHDGADARGGGGRDRRRGAGLGPRLRRHQLDAGGRAGGGQAARARRSRRGRPALVEPQRCPRRSTGCSRTTWRRSCSRRPRPPSRTSSARGSRGRVHLVGDVMFDAARHYGRRSSEATPAPAPRGGRDPLRARHGPPRREHRRSRPAARHLRRPDRGGQGAARRPAPAPPDPPRARGARPPRRPSPPGSRCASRSATST